MKPQSIRQIFSRANRLMIFLALIPLLTSIFLYSRQLYIYQKTITNIQDANSITSDVDRHVLESMWDLVTGQTPLNEYKKKTVLEELREKIRHIHTNTTTQEESNILAVTNRTIDTLQNYEDQLIKNIENERPNAENESIMNQVDSVTQLLSEILQDFVRVEIGVASDKNKEMVRSIILLTILEMIILLVTFLLIQKSNRLLRAKIETPINELSKMATEFAQGNLNYRLPVPEAYELATLTKSMNTMADDLNIQLEENALKQYHLAQSEIRVLQAQITPHFIYNSLDAIVTLIDQEQYSEATEMTYALSDFFRISLSKGKDWVTLQTELRHVHDYLKILKIRYGSMLNYKISADESLYGSMVLKMILQPIIENAIYHGTKFVRRVGEVKVEVSEFGDRIQYVVTDNGQGITPERLKEIRLELAKGVDSDFSVGYGLYNVNKRLLLYYGYDASLTIDSTYLSGTVVTIRVPKKKGAYL